MPPLRYGKAGPLEGTWLGALGGLAVALMCKVTGSEGALTAVQQPHGGAVLMTATLEFKCAPCRCRCCAASRLHVMP